MPSHQREHGFRRRAYAIAILALAGGTVLFAERLPFKNYSRADGLATGEVQRIVRDSRGFLWFCAQGGLTFFDGYRFHTYNLESSRLPFPSSNDLLESGGAFWIATNGYGVWRFDPTRSSASADTHIVRFSLGDSAASNRVNTLFQDGTGRLWAGTDGGVFRLDRLGPASQFHRMPIHAAQHTEEQTQAWQFLPDPDGSLWIGTKFGLMRILPDGRMVQYEVQPALGSDHVRALLRDGQGRLWVAHQRGLLIFIPEPPSSAPVSGIGRLAISERREIAISGRTPASLPVLPGRVQAYRVASSSFQDDTVMALGSTADGHIWLGMVRNGLIGFDGLRFSHYGSNQGLGTSYITALGEDAGGNLWVGSIGATRLARNGFASYDRSDGLPQDPVASMTEDREGRLYVTSLRWQVGRFDGERFTNVRPRLPPQSVSSGWGICRGSLLDHLGDWWFAGRDGLWRFSGIRRLEDLATHIPRVFKTTDGLAENDVEIVFEDSRGNVWISYFAPRSTPLTRWVRASGRFQHYSKDEGLTGSDTVSAFREDSAGDLWIGYRGAGLACYRGGRFQDIPIQGSQPPGGVNSLFLDRVGRLWAGTQRTGLVRIDNPLADHPSAVTYTTSQGLSANAVRGVTEDLVGSIYAITGNGVNRIDLDNGRISLYRDSDGISGFEVQSAFTDRYGTLWFGTDRGPLRLVRREEAVSAPPAVFIGGLRIGGFPYPVSDLGAAEVRGLALAAGQRQIHIDFFALGFGGGEPLRYQYRLGGSGLDWSAPSEQAAVDFANLAPGRYEFAARAISADGVMSVTPATVAFSVPAPLWRRWWALAIAACLLSLAVYTVHRYRLGRLLELERVRIRIATDLHDDIGSTLSQISVLSEVVRQQLHPESVVIEPLSLITGMSRDLVDSLSDIVWAINPTRDHLADVTQRMRRFASDLLSARNLDFTFQAPATQLTLKMGADLRREVFLVFKEAVHNAVRHAACTRVEIRLTAESGWLELHVKDDGQGFDGGRTSNGNGLSSMRQRAARIGGVLDVISSTGKGTTVRLRAPIGRRIHALQ